MKTTLTREQYRLYDSIHSSIQFQKISIEEYAVRTTQKLFDYMDMYQKERLENKKLRAALSEIRQRSSARPSVTNNKNHYENRR